MNVTGNTKITGTTEISGKTTIDDDLDVTGNLKVTGTTNISGATNIDDNLTVTGKANVSGATTIDGATTINNNLTVTGNTNTSGNANVGGNLNVTGNTKITGATNISGETTIDDNLKVTGNLNVTGSTTLAATTATTISASTSVKTPLVSASTISADTIYTKNGLEKSLSWEYGSVSTKTGSSYNGKESKTITVPKTISDVSSGKVTSDSSGNMSIAGNVGISGTVTAGNPIYYSSDINLKENVADATAEQLKKAESIEAKSFNFKDTPNQLVYGVIAQDVQLAGLGEIVHKDEKGFLAVDYTSLMILKIKNLENLVKELTDKIEKLENKK